MQYKYEKIKSNYFHKIVINGKLILCDHNIGFNNKNIISLKRKNILSQNTLQKYTFNEYPPLVNYSMDGEKHIEYFSIYNTDKDINFKIFFKSIINNRKYNNIFY